VSYLQPNWSAPKHIKAYSSTRVDGKSVDVYASMNLGAHVGDDDQRVTANRKKLNLDLSLPSEPLWLNQVHSTKLVNLDLPIATPADGSRLLTADGSCSLTADGSCLLTADGSYSKNSQTVCVVMTADCLPLLLSNRKGDQVAAVHVGWRGLAKGIIEKAVAQFACAPDEIIAWAGPCIGPDKFEIGIDVRHQLGGNDDCYLSSKNNKLFANLYLLCEQRLKAAGVTTYSHAAMCTYSDKAQFFSYRRDGRCGRMASLIWIDRPS